MKKVVITSHSFTSLGLAKFAARRHVEKGWNRTPDGLVWGLKNVVFEDDERGCWHWWVEIEASKEGGHV